jgi:hypothetical protein
MSSQFFADVFRVIHPLVLEEVKNRQEIHRLKECLGVHIRGTDRIRRTVMREVPIQWLVIAARNEGCLNGKPMIAISDDPKSFQVWKNFFPDIKLLSGLSLQAESDKGIHNLNRDELKVSKDAANIECLIDFFSLASCDRSITTYSDSRFFTEAQRLSRFVDTILSS